LQIDPWSSHQFADYEKLRDEFGLESFEPIVDELPDPPAIFERGIVFAHRGFEPVRRAIQYGDDWAVMTGLMPSGNMHFGHKMVLDQVEYFQSIGAEVFIGVADLEAYATRGIDLDEGREVAIEEYAKNYLAIGLDPDRAQVYFQSKRSQVQKLAFLLADHVNLTKMQKLYGFGGEDEMSHILSPIVQAADILHPQLPENGGARPVLVPVGVDQDPHLRLARDLAEATRLFGVTTIDDDGPAHLGVSLKVTEDERNLDRIARRLDVDRKAIVGELLDRAANVIRDVGFADVEIDENYRVIEIPAAREADRHAIDVPLAQLEQELGELGFVAPASTYHRFMSGLTGDKMSSSEPETAIFLSDTYEEAADKINQAKTGGKPTAAEQREEGANPYACPIFGMYTYHLMPDDEDLEDIETRCKGGDILCGECKGIARERAHTFLDEHQTQRAENEDKVTELVRDD
jgi:tryptophanyl-tRNA synthetase